MPSHAFCVVGVCDNNKRYPERIVKHGNVKGEVIMHKLPTDEDLKKEYGYNRCQSAKRILLFLKISTYVQIIS